MKLWLISQSVNHGYNTFDSAVVAAESEEEARCIYPGDWNADTRWSGTSWLTYLDDGRVLNRSGSCWTTPKNVTVEFLSDGFTGEAGNICASFNAG